MGRSVRGAHPCTDPLVAIGRKKTTKSGRGHTPDFASTTVGNSSASAAVVDQLQLPR